MSLFPGFDQLFVLSDPVADRPYRGKFDHPNGFEISRAEHDVRVVAVNWTMGASSPSDIVWTTSAHPLIVSARVRQLFDDAGLTGWTTYPVNLFDKKGDSHPGYSGLAIVGRCGRIDLERSTIKLHEYPGGYFPHFGGYFFEESSWDGSDFCVDRADHLGKSSMTRIVTRRVADLLKKHGIPNVQCVPLSEVSISTSVFEIGSHHLLPHDFRTRVASAYREAGMTAPTQYR